jgi:hypothetical protein
MQPYPPSGGRIARLVEKPPIENGRRHIVTPPGTRMRPPKVYRGSRARLKRTNAWTQTPASIWILFALSLGAVFLVLAWLASRPSG